MKNIHFLVFLFFSSVINLSTARAQDFARRNYFSCGFGREKSWGAGFDFQVYPAGQIYGLRVERFFGFGHQINVRLGYNRAFRKDFSGLNDDEQGGGPGFSLGYRYYLTNLISQNVFVGTRVDLWRLRIFWKDKNQSPAMGTTDITVLQPTFEVGYRQRLARKLFASVYAGFGREINVVTQGDPVGQGGISFAGLTLCYRLK